MVGTETVETMEWEAHDLGGGHVTYSPHFVYKPMEITLFVPLFVGNKGSVIQSGDYIYTLGGFKVGSYRAAESRARINRKPVVTEYYYAYNLRWIAPGITFFLGIRATDPDGDQLTWNWTSSYPEKPQSDRHPGWWLEYSVYNQPDVIQVKGNKNIGYVTFYANISDGHESIDSNISVNITTLCYLNMIDHMTRYTGRIGNGGAPSSAHSYEYWNRITGFEDHNGTPFLQFIGFPDDYVGHQVGFVFVKDHVHNHITEKFPDLYPDNGWDSTATITLDIWNDTRNVMLNGSRNESDIPGGGHGAIRVGTGYLPYGKYTFCAFLESRTDPGKYYVYCCHIDNELTGHGSVD
jgi:hypothetical protein